MQTRGMTRRQILAGGAAMSVLSRMGAAKAGPKVRILSNWFAEAEHGGYYQAQATGIYEREGLDVDLVMGGPQVNGMQLLAAGRADFLMSHSILTLSAVQQGLPVITVAACYQTDLQCVVAHEGVKSLTELKGRKIFISTSSRGTFWPWLKAKYGLTDEQTGAYTGTLQPFLSDPNSVVGGIISSEPYAAQKAGAKITPFLLANDGYPPYGAPLVANLNFYKENPDVVRRVVKATMMGWRDYLKDPTEGNKLIKIANPHQPDEMNDYGLKVMKDLNIIGSGDAATMGIGIMTEARWKQIAEFMMEYGLLKRDMNWKAAFTTEFVDGLNVKL